MRNIVCRLLVYICVFCLLFVSEYWGVYLTVCVIEWVCGGMGVCVCVCVCGFVCSLLCVHVPVCVVFVLSVLFLKISGNFLHLILYTTPRLNCYTHP